MCVRACVPLTWPCTRCGSWSCLHHGRNPPSTLVTYSSGAAWLRTQKGSACKHLCRAQYVYVACSVRRRFGWYVDIHTCIGKYMPYIPTWILGYVPRNTCETCLTTTRFWFAVKRRLGDEPEHAPTKQLPHSCVHKRASASRVNAKKRKKTGRLRVHAPTKTVALVDTTPGEVGGGGMRRKRVARTTAT